ncbi:MAG: B12-binding domain-containing radical SAM protein [Acidimicrobiales bacterium]
MRINLVSLEDGITACGFRKFAAFAARLEPDTTSYYVSTVGAFRSILRNLRRTTQTDELGPADVDLIARQLADCDILGVSSMTGYSKLTRAIISRVREIRPETFIIWGGIHPIIHPTDAITADVDAICTGEGELAFEEFLGRYKAGEDYSGVLNFWFKVDGNEIRNGFRPLMTADELEQLPFAQYREPGELMYRPGKGFTPLGLSDYLANDGLGYATVWSIGCPFHCTFCGNTKFIDNDPAYKKVRHPSPRYVVDEIKHVLSRSPHVSLINFFDDSFMAIPYREIEELSELWHDELEVPFMVWGVIPNYVNRDKVELLTWAGMNRVRMGIQSGSQRILDFYKRPTPPERVLAAAEVLASFSPEYHIPPAYDIIVDNPIETRQDVVDTLEFLYKMARPYTLFVYSLRVIPNTELEKSMIEMGLNIEEISANYLVIPPHAANLLLYLLAMWRPPRPIFDRLLTRVRASTEPQPLYPRLGTVVRGAYLARNAANNLRFMDFSVVPGWPGWLAWRLGLIGTWRSRVRRRPPRPTRPAPVARLAQAAGGEDATETMVIGPTRRRAGTG